MISQEIYLEKYDWKVLVFYGLESSDTDEVCNSLVQIGCTRESKAQGSIAYEEYRTQVLPTPILQVGRAWLLLAGPHQNMSS